MNRKMVTAGFVFLACLVVIGSTVPGPARAVCTLAYGLVGPGVILAYALRYRYEAGATVVIAGGVVLTYWTLSSVFLILVDLLPSRAIATAQAMVLLAVCTAFLMRRQRGRSEALAAANKATVRSG